MAFTTHDNAPYLYRKSGGGGDLEIDKLVGGTIAWNQIIADTFNADGTHQGVTYTRNADGSITVSGTVTGYTSSYRQIWDNTNITVGHKYYATTGLANSTCYLWYNGGGGFDTSGGRKVGIITTLANGFYIRCNGEGTTVNETLRPQVFDLTLMFGSAIADYVYSLEQSSQGSGLAWLRSYGFFTEDYYDYNSGELKSVSNLVSHDMTGKNLCPTFTSGTASGLTYTVNDDGSVHVTGTCTGTAFWAVQLTLPKGTYVLSGVPTNGQLTLRNARGGGAPSSAFSGTLDDYGNGATFTVSETASAWLNIRSTAGTHDKTYRPMIRLSSVSDATYEPYTLHSYPLGDVTLRGLPKLNGNALYYDGDTYESNGTVTRKYGIVDLGSLTWGYRAADSSKPYPQEYATLSGVVSGISTNVVCPKYSASQEPVLGRTVDKTICTFNGAVYVSDSSYSTATEFKTAMSGVYLVYELAEETTETADTYTNPQWVDPNGTERYTLSTNAFPMPVGHETTYNTDIGSKTVNTQVNLSMTEPQVRQVYAKEGDTARVLNIHLDQTEEDGTLRILRPDGTEVTADAVLVPDFYDGLMAEIPSDATSVVGKCYCDVEQNGVSSMPFTLNVKKNERES